MSLLEHDSYISSASGCCACETNCNALYYVMPIETTRIVVNQAWISSKLKLIATLWKIWKELFSKHFPRHFQSFCCRIHFYWVTNSLPPVCSHAIRTILMVGVRITLSFQPRVIWTQTINIFSYCMNKQGITNSVPGSVFVISFLYWPVLFVKGYTIFRLFAFSFTSLLCTYDLYFLNILMFFNDGK